MGRPLLALACLDNPSRIVDRHLDCVGAHQGAMLGMSRDISLLSMHRDIMNLPARLFFALDLGVRRQNFWLRLSASRQAVLGLVAGILYQVKKTRNTIRRLICGF